MKNSIKFGALIVLLLAVFSAGAWYGSRSRSRAAEPAGRKVLYWHDPMHPAYKSDKPGIAPDCGMQLEPVYARDAASIAGMEEDISAPPGAVNVRPDRQQLIGVQVAAVTKAAGEQTLRIPGRVVPDETRIYRINAATDGWVREICPVTTGSLAKKDDLLAKIYAPETFSAMKAYLYGLRSQDRFQAAKEGKEQMELTDANIENYRNALRNQGMTEHQLDEIMRTRQGANVIEVRATARGFIIARNITLGQRFERGTEFYRIADLSRVWILADVFGREARCLKPEMWARVSLPDQGIELKAKVSDVLPQFDPATRTLKVRLETDNPGYDLKPDMFVDVEFPIHLPPSLAVPRDAVVDTGSRKRVFVDRGNGFYESREVETGWRFGDRVQILSGLTEGERIVVSGTFLVDSESRMKAAAAGIYQASKDPACGMDIDEGKASVAGHMSSYQGKTYYFCSEMCKRNFDKEPGRFLKQPPVTTEKRKTVMASDFGAPR